ncbi:MAG: ABC transporter substrate-binding protein [Myxococcota bacterium]
MKLIKKAVAFAGGLALSASGCMPSCNSCADGSQRLAQRDVLRLTVASPPEAFDPRFTTSAVAQRISQLIYGRLFVVGDDLLPQPFLAESAENVDDRTVKVTLREGLTFHDGSPLTARDVAYTFNHLGDDDVRSPHAVKFAEFLDNAQAINDREVLFKLKRPYAPVLTDIAAIGIVSRKRCEGRSQTCKDEHAGSGPFRIKQWDAATETLTLQPHGGWFEGAPKIKQLIVRVVRDPNTRLLELLDGKTDLSEGELNPANIPTIEKSDRLVLKRVPGLGYTYLAMNVRPPQQRVKGRQAAESESDRTRRALSNPQVRRAIGHALDIDGIIQTRLRGMAQRAAGMLPPGHWALDSSLQPIPRNLDEAKRLLDAAGFADRGEKNGGRFRMTLSTTPNRLRQSIALVHTDSLRKVGIDVQLRAKEWSALYQDIKEGNFEMFSAIWVPVTEPDLFHWVFHSGNIPSPDNAGGNRGAFVDRELDTWLDEARVTMDRTKRIALYKKAQQRLDEKLPYIPLWFEDRLVVFNKRVQGFTPTRTGSLLPLRKAWVREKP